MSTAAPYLISVVQHREGPDDIPQFLTLKVAGSEGHLPRYGRQTRLVSLKGGEDKGVGGEGRKVGKGYKANTLMFE